MSEREGDDEGEAYEYSQGQLEEIGRMREGLEDDGVSYPRTTDHVQATETG